MNTREQSTSHTFCYMTTEPQGWGSSQGHCPSLLHLQSVPGTRTQLLTWGTSSAPLWNFTRRHTTSSWGWSSTKKCVHSLKMWDKMKGCWCCLPALEMTLGKCCPGVTCPTWPSTLPASTPRVWQAAGEDGWLGCSSPGHRRHFLGVAH